jgi:hypothetical protein
MKRVKLFEQFHTDLSAMHESMMSEIDLIGRQSPTKEAFKKEVAEFIEAHAKSDPSVAKNDEYLEGLASTYFDKDGKKIDIEE